MNKYSMIIFHSDVTSFLERLQGLGMVDIKRESKAVDTHSRSLYDLLHRYRHIIKKLSSFQESIADKSLIDYTLANKGEGAEKLLDLSEECLNNSIIWEQELQMASRE
ncbi:MAG: hypothetical protein WC833_12690 [Bacteroidales bacterium]